MKKGEIFMKQYLACGYLVVVFVSGVFASNGPLRRTGSIDGHVEIANLVVEKYMLPGYKVDGGAWQRLEMPENLAGNAQAISGDGRVICGLIHERDSYAPIDSYVARASVWYNDNTTLQEPVFRLLDLPLLAGAHYSSALDISENGRYTIGFCQEQPLVGEQACYWDVYGVHSLGTITYDSFLADSTYPHSVSNDNIIVGTALGSDNSYQLAFIWDQIHGMRYLKDVLETEYGYNFSGCTLSQAYNISPDGRIIDGYGYNQQGDYFDWVVTIPEPASLLLLGLGGLFLRRKAGCGGVKL